MDDDKWMTNDNCLSGFSGNKVMPREFKQFFYYYSENGLEVSRIDIEESYS